MNRSVLPMTLFIFRTSWERQRRQIRYLLTIPTSHSTITKRRSGLSNPQKRGISSTLSPANGVKTQEIHIQQQNRNTLTTTVIERDLVRLRIFIHLAVGWLGYGNRMSSS